MISSAHLTASSKTQIVAGNSGYSIVLGSFRGGKNGRSNQQNALAAFIHRKKQHSEYKANKGQ
jgi:hypothetical protein